MLVSVIVGARPNFMKVAPLIPALRERGITPRLVHTGQHYDRSMSGAFFEELAIPEPEVNLGIGSGSHVFQIAEVMRRLEDELSRHRPAYVIVVGDVNSTVAAAIAANRLGIRVAHVEAGLRSGDRGMPEEMNRIITDAISDLLLTSEPVAEHNLRREGIPAERIHFVGNTMIDTLRRHIGRAIELRAFEPLGLRQGEYAVLTLHRPSNVDFADRLESILRAVAHVGRSTPVVFPLHPRTESRLRQFGLDGRSDLAGYVAIRPQSYLPMLSLMNSARVVLTDSGGIQEETTALGVPCLTLRESTERPITTTQGTNQLVGWHTDSIVAAFEAVRSGQSPHHRTPDLWDGRSAERIAAVLENATANQRRVR
ncbi:MAG: UDP-N-acetylglucosamine 2-epimerase (non-hydrolyzing) [Planctomycetes bacterium]|nr:UDP-N-acetylglucosamine 2-epimerase (non-hydrolyzing) [Planctomycetota bacterium]